MKIEELVDRRYVHWTSAMRDEMERVIREAEKRIEAEHFPNLPPCIPGLESELSMA
jgi:hypothetical protein